MRKAVNAQTVRAGWVQPEALVGHWTRTTRYHVLEVWQSPEGFDWTVRDVTGALLESGIECMSTLARDRASKAARAISGAWEATRGRSAP